MAPAGYRGGLGAGLLLLMCSGAATAQEANGCASLYDPATRAPAADVYISVERPGQEPACFLLPRAVTKSEYRDLYRDGVTAPFEFDPAELSRYLDGAKHMVVGSDRRVVDLDNISCLKNPTPDSFAVLGERAVPVTIEAARSRMKEAATDVPGYRRYIDEYDGDNYFSDNQDSGVDSFWCSNRADPKICGIVGEYDGMRVGIRYFKRDISDVQPARALRCVRTIAALFRLK
jgi:hypothetical protein